MICFFFLFWYTTIHESTLPIERKTFSATSQKPRSYRVYISPAR